jgi:hypothetical protein
MKKVLEFVKNFLQKNGGIKILVAFAILIASVLCVRGNVLEGSSIFAITGYISLGYIIIVGGIFFGAGNVNTIKDAFKK